MAQFAGRHIYKTTNKADGVTTVHVDSELTSTDHSRALKSVVSVKVKGYRARVARGELFNNPYFKTEENDTDSEYAISITQENEGTIADYDYSGLSTFELVQGIPPSGWEEVNSYAGSGLSDHNLMQKAMASMDSTPYEFMEDVGERKKTVESLKAIGNDMKSVVTNHDSRYTRELKNLTYSKVFKNAGPARRALLLANIASKLWLELRYAIRPLMISTENVLEEAILYRTHSPVRRRSRQRDLETVEKVYVYHQGYLKIERKLKTSTKTAATIMYEATNPLHTNENFNHVNGMRIRDIPETAWNLVPASFLVDRVLNVSRGINAAMSFADPQVNVLMACMSALIETTDTYTVTPDDVDRQLAMGPDLLVSRTNSAIGSYSSSKTEKRREPRILTIADAIPEFDFSVQETANVFDLVALGLRSLNKRVK